MGWLVGPILASLVTSFIVVKIFDYIFEGVTGVLVNIARFGLFGVTWTAVTAQAGMHGFSRRVRQLRQATQKRR